MPQQFINNARAQWFKCRFHQQAKRVPGRSVGEWWKSRNLRNDPHFRCLLEGAATNTGDFVNTNLSACYAWVSVQLYPATAVVLGVFLFFI